MAKATHNHKAADPVEENKVPENVDVAVKGTPTQQADKNEEKAAKKAEKDGHNPNSLDNPETHYMTEAQAKEVIKRYEKGEYREEPNDLIHAKRILKHK